MQLTQSRILTGKLSPSESKLDGFLTQKTSGVGMDRLTELQKQQDEQNARTRARQLELDRVLLQT